MCENRELDFSDFFMALLVELVVSEEGVAIEFDYVLITD